MNSIPFRRGLVLFFSFLMLSCATGGTYPIHLRYQPEREFSSLQMKLGSTIGLAPFEDQRSDTSYIGFHSSLRGVSSYFRSDPFPLEKAIKESLSQVLSGYRIKTVPISNWDGKPESLKNMESDSVIRIEIKKFWTKGTAAPFRTNVNTWIHLVIDLGVKQQGKVFTRNVHVEKEMTVTRLTPERVETAINQILTEIFDNFLSNPYKI